MTLFIIGNGFDKAHGFKTGYEDFRDYLNENDYNIVDNFSLFEFFNNEDESLWSDFENRLGEVDYEGVVSDYSSDLTDDLSDKEWDWASSNNSYLCEVFEDILTKFKPCLCQAVSDFVLNAVTYDKKLKKTKFSKEFIKDSIFVTFNYSKTLEKIYAIEDKRIFHIHGLAYYSEIKNNEFSFYNYDEPSIILGHGDFIIEGDEADLYEQNPFSPHEILNALPALLRKDYQTKKLNSFLSNYKNITEIQIIGHGLGDVDSCYFNQIHDILPYLKKITYWYYRNDIQPENQKLEKLRRYFPGKEISIVQY